MNKGAFATLAAIFKAANVRLYHEGRDDEHRHAGEVCAIGLYEAGIWGVRFKSAPYGFRLEIDDPVSFYAHPQVARALREFGNDRPMYELGSVNPILQSFFTREEYVQALVAAMGDSRELSIDESALHAFVRGFETAQPANDDRERMLEVAVS